MRTIILPRLVPERPQTNKLYPEAFSSTPMRRARNARSCPRSPDVGSTSAVVLNGIVAGSHCQRSFSGGKLAGLGLEFLLIRTSEGRYSSTPPRFLPFALDTLFPACALGIKRA